MLFCTNSRIPATIYRVTIWLIYLNVMEHLPIFTRISVNEQMNFGLPTKMKAKLVREKRRGFIQVQHGLGEWWTPVSKTSPSSCSSLPFLIVIGRRGFFPIQLSCQHLACVGHYTFIFLAFKELSVRISPEPSWPVRETPQWPTDWVLT